MNAQDYQREQLNSMPKGRLWPRALDSLISSLLLAFGDSAGRFDAKLDALLEEADPRQANELIDAWERMVGIPDTCTGSAVFLEDRRAAIWQKITQVGGQTAEYFIAVAERLGCIVTIQEFPTFHAGSMCGMPCYGAGWKSVWQVTILSAPDGTATLECVLRRLKPAHTALYFAYAEGTYPAFYYDFTTEEG